MDRDFSWRRCVAWTVALGLHAVALVALTVPIRLHDAPRRDATASESPSRSVDQLLMVPVALPRPRSASIAASSVTRPPPRGRTRAQQRPAVIDAESYGAPTAAARPAEVALRDAADLFDDEGRARLPDEPLFASTPPPRTGDWHTPGDGSEDDAFYRPRALDPRTTRFARAWRPTQTLGGEWYERLMRATTGVVSVPVNQKFNLVCGVSIAGLGGGCLIVRDGGTGVIVERGEPAPWARSNRAQCRGLRDELAAAAEADRVAFLLDRLTALCSRPDVDADAAPRP